MTTREERIDIFKGLLAEKHTILWQTWCVDDDRGRQAASEWAVDLFDEMFTAFITGTEPPPQKNKLEWTTVEGMIVDGPVPPKCEIGIAGHVWSLSIEEGRVCINSNCDVCNKDFQELDSEVLGMEEIGGRLVFNHDHKGQPHRGPGPCDCNWWWVFEPDGSPST